MPACLRAYLFNPVLACLASLYLQDVTSQLKKQNRNNKKAAFPVGCITTDFAMQNVALQMGLNVVSIDGTKQPPKRSAVP